MWQIYLPAPRKIPRPKFDVSGPNEVHQADLLFLPHDRRFKYALTVVDVASRYKEAEPGQFHAKEDIAPIISKIVQW